MDILRRSFNLLYVDFPGVNGTPYEGDQTFNELSRALQTELQKISGSMYVLGHSYGGFFAADLSLTMILDGIICVATPFTKKSLLAVSENYAAKKSQELSDTQAEWEKLQDDKSFAKWISEYGELYFIKPKGRDLLLNDKVSAKFCLAMTLNLPSIFQKSLELMRQLNTLKGKNMMP